MPADGSILIDTEIQTDGMQAGTKEVETAVRRMAESIDDLGKGAEIAIQKQVAAFAKANNAFAAQEQKVADLKKKIEEYGATRIPTEEYKEIQKQISDTEIKLRALQNRQERFLETGGRTKSSTFQRMQYDIDELTNTLAYAQTEMEDLKNSGKAFTLGKDTEQYSAMTDKYVAETQKLLYMNETLGASYTRIKNEFNEYQQRLKGVDISQKKAEKSGRKLNRTFKDTKKSTHGAGLSLKKLFTYVFGIRSLFALLNRLRGSLKEGMDNLSQYSADTNTALSLVMSSMTQLKNAFATAFSPLAEVAAPILAQFISLLSEAATWASQLFSALTGKETFVRAVKVQQDYAESLKGTAQNTKDAAKEAKKALAPFDDLIQIQFPKDTSTSDSDLLPSQMFETLEVSNEMKLAADDIKKTFAGLFDPLKESWVENGPALFDSVKNMFSAFRTLAKDVGASFMQVWNAEGYGKAITDDLLITFSNLAQTVANLVIQFDKAWKSGDTGTSIIRHLGDIILEFTGLLRAASESIKNWAADLDFSPLLMSFDRALAAIRPIVGDIGDLLLWLLDSVLLPLGKWALEQLFPAALDLIAAALTALHSVIVALQPLGLWLWENFLQPLGEWAGEKIIEALEQITEKLYAFSAWIEQNQEKVQAAALIIAGFLAAFEAITFVSKISGIIKSLGTFGSAAGKAASATGLLGSAFSFIASPAGLATVAIGGIIGASIYLIATNEELREKVVAAYENHIKPALERLGAKFKEIMEGPVVDALKSAMECIEKLWKDVLEPLLEWIIGNILPVAAPIIEMFGDIVLDVFEGLAIVVTGFFDTLSGLIDFIAGVFTGDWRKAWEGVKTIFEGIFEMILGVLYGVGKSILDFIEGIIDTAREAIKAVGELFNGSSSYKKSSGYDYGNHKLNHSSRAIPYAAYAAIPYNPPMLATGTVVPPRAGISYFGIGDNNKEPEVVSPLSTIKQALKEAMAEASGGNERAIEIKMYVKDQVFASAVYQANNQEKQRVGVRLVSENA